MRRLFLMRHGEAASCPELDDRRRPLTERGTREASRAASELRDRGESPGLIVCSDALRAVTTGRAVADVCGSELQEEPALYLATPQVYLKTLSRVADRRDSVLVVGHNPGLEEFLQLLTGKRAALTPASLARIGLTITDWGEMLGHPRGELLELRRPGSPI